MQQSIAVIMAVRNGLPFLDEAIQCVKSQSYSPLELVIVDDGSTDGSLEALQNAGLRILQTPSLGPAAARNAGIRATVSDAIAFLDVDDLWAPGTLNRLGAALGANRSAGFAQGLIQNFRVLEDGSKRFFTSPYRFVNLGAALFRRSLFDTVGLLDETLRFSEDVDFLMRCWEKDVRRALVDEVTLYYRRHPDSLTASVESEGFGAVQAVKRRMDRARHGLYDPKQPRHLPGLEYIGLGPKSHDDEQPGNTAHGERRKFSLLWKEYATWRHYRKELSHCSYVRFLAERWSVRSTWQVPFVGAKRVFQKMAEPLRRSQAPV